MTYIVSRGALNSTHSLRTSARNTRSSSVPLLCVPFRRTSFARRPFSTAAPLTWNSMPPAVLNCDSLLSNRDLKLTCVFYCCLLTILPTCSASASVANGIMALYKFRIIITIIITYVHTLRVKKQHTLLTLITSRKIVVLRHCICELTRLLKHYGFTR